MTTWIRSRRKTCETVLGDPPLRKARLGGLTDKKTKIFLGIGVAVLAAAALVLPRCAAGDAVYPLEKAKRWLSRRVAAPLRAMADGAAAKVEAAKLRRQRDALAFGPAECAALREENARLRDALGFARRPGVSRIAAEVLSRGGGAASAFDTIRLDKGAKDGVEAGATVETPDGLVGRVADVSHRSCSVLLATDPSLRVAVKFDGSPSATGVACGGSGDALELKWVSAKAAVAPHSRVATSGLGGVFPAGVTVGFYADGRVTPAVDFDALDIVFIRTAAGPADGAGSGGGE